jgi:O-antigen/teichoic acid export membrane protein
LIRLIKQIAPNFIRLGLIQVSSIAVQLMIIPLVIQRAGIMANGQVLTALSVSVVFSILINYGTNQAGPLALSEGASAPSKELPGKELSEILYVRLLLFVLSLGFIFFWYAVEKEMGVFLLGIVPILFSEVINPYVVCISRNKLQALSLVSLLGRITGLALVYFFWHDAQAAYWVNAWIGIALTVFFILFWMVELRANRISFSFIRGSHLRSYLKKHVSLVASNLMVHFQQALILYVIGLVATPAVWGLYAIIDKLIGGCRTLLISFSGAAFTLWLNIFPQGEDAWKKFRRQVNQLLGIGLLILGLGIYFGADGLALLLATTDNSKELANAFRMAASIPLITGLNLMNVLELILKKNFKTIYHSNLILMGWVIMMAGLLYILNQVQGTIEYGLPILALLLIELFTLLVYEKNRRYSS